MEEQQDWKAEWRWKSLPPPRPFYGLELLAQRPNAPLIILEGEGKCDAARRIFPDHICISPMGGAKAPNKTDWSPLQGRDVVICPDNDKPGQGFVVSVLGLLKGIAASILVVDIEKVVVIDGGKRPANRKIDGWDIADAEKEWVDLSALKAAVLAAAKPASASSNWGPRGDLGAAELPPVAKFNPKLLPLPIRDWVVDEAARMPCAIDFVAVAAVTSLASVIGASCTLHPKGKDPWAVPAILWGMIVGPPGDLKTAAMNAAIRLLRVLIEEARLKYEEEMLAYSVEKKKYDALMGGLEDDLKKAGKSKSDRGAAVASVLEKQRDLEARAPKEPIRRRYETQDVTIEKLSDLLCDNPRGIMHRLDELARLLFGFERQDHGGDRAVYLEGYEGLYSQAIDRIKRGERRVPNNCITVLGGVQPDVLGAWLYVASDITRNDGFPQRFGLMVYPDRTVWGWINEAPAPGAYARALDVARTLADFDPVAWGAVKGEYDKFPWFQFGLDAQEVFIEWLTDLRNVRIPKEDDSLIRQHLAKYDRVFCSLALTFHLIDRADHEVRSRHGVDPDGNVYFGSVGNYVSEECARRAAAWCGYLETHARRCYALLGHHRISNARMLAAKIKRGDLEDGFTKREIIRHQWTGLQSDEAVREALDWLEAERWIRRAPRPVGQGGRPTDRYEIHPDIRSAINSGSTENDDD